MKTIKFILTIGIFFIATLLSCNKDTLNVANQNDPDFLKVYADGASLENLASGLYNTIYTGEHSYSGVEMALATASDNITCSWGNQAMRDMSYEPRNNAWNNSPSYSYNGITYYLFNKMYSVINTSSNILKAVKKGTVIGNGGSDVARTRAICKFAQGVAYGNLALIFDKAFVVDENITAGNDISAAKPYTDVATAAIGYLDTAIALCGTTFTVPASWLGTAADLTNNDLKKICNTYAARILSYTPRNKTMLAAVNWGKVQAYADAGITTDFNVINDNYVKWYDEAADYLTSNGWGATDMYVVNMMDPTQPQHWDDTPTFPTPAPSTNPVDKRLNSDFEYIPSNWFNPARGYYHFTSYRSKRYDALYVNAVGPKPQILKAENDMLRAEARAYASTPDLAGAIAIINAGTRVTRGQMLPVTPVVTEIVKAIHHERHVEMYTTGVGLQFFEMRKLNLLQKGTPLHLPLPAQTLQTFGLPLPYYTFGMVANADGINTSNAGWR